MRDFTGTRCEVCAGILKRVVLPNATGLICVNQHCANSRIERRIPRRWLGRLTLVIAILSIGLSIYNGFAHKKLDNLRLSIIKSQQVMIQNLSDRATQYRNDAIETNRLMIEAVLENSLLRKFIESQGVVIDSVKLDYPDPRTFKPVDVI